MRGAMKILVPLVVLAEVVLVWSGVMDFGDAVLVVAGLEVLLFLVGLGSLLLVVRRYRLQRRAGLDAWKALEDGLSLVIPRAAARLVLHEPRLFVSLLRWTSRQASLAAGEYSYHRRSLLRAILPVVIITSPLELLVVHLLAHVLSPWAWLKWLLLGLGVYAVLWLLGLYASLVTYPHKLEATGLRVRYGVLADGFIPYKEIEDAVRREGKAPHSGDGLSPAYEEDALYLATAGKTDVALRLSSPRSVHGLFRETGPASLIYLAVDAPAGFVEELCSRLEAPASDLATVRQPVENRNP